MERTSRNPGSEVRSKANSPNGAALIHAPRSPFSIPNVPFINVEPMSPAEFPDGWRINVFLEDRGVVCVQFGSNHGIVKPRLTVLGAVDDMNDHLGQ